MFSKIRPFIFKLDPELAHDLATVSYTHLTLPTSDLV